MVFTKRPTLPVRALPRLALIVPIALLTASAGCRHRSSYRPVFPPQRAILSPAAPCPTGDCGGAYNASAPAFADPGTITSPPLPFGSDSLQPAAPGGRDNFDEPGLDLGVQPSAYESFDDGGSRGPALEAPRTSLRPSDPRRSAVEGQSAPAPRSRRAALRQRVGMYVDDADDLFTPPRADRPWRYVVLHHSARDAGGLAQIDADHRDRLGTVGCGYHFVIGNGTGSPDGRIEVARRWAEQKPGAHCRDSKVPAANEYGIGICLVGNLDATAPTPRQLEAARALVAYLQDRYDIPAVNLQSHSEVAGIPTHCPGRNFPADALLGGLGRTVASR